METVSEILTQIKSIVRSFFPEAEVILFGSRARGDNQMNSDYDLLIIVDDQQNNSERLRSQAMIRKVLSRHQILADVIIHSKSEIAIKRTLPGHLVRIALMEGIRV
jgi:predicted nucleotidyltransferase